MALLRHLCDYVMPAVNIALRGDSDAVEVAACDSWSTR